MGRAVELYDFSRPATLVREHARRLEGVFETFARQWATQLTSRLRINSTVTSGNVTTMTYNDYAGSLPEETLMVLVALDGHEARGVMQFPVNAALSWVSRMLGSTGTQAPSFRKLTEIEQALIRRLAEDALEDLGYSFGPLLSARMRVTGMHFNSRTAQATATDTSMVVAPFTVRSGAEEWQATVALPAQLVLSQLVEQDPAGDTGAAALLLRGQVSQVPVEVAVELVATPVTATAILHLAVGDVLAIPHPVGKPFSVTLNGKAVARAVGVAHGSRQGAQIVSIEENVS
ncbi:hypothetical protein AOC05_15915 [Arthrobacter alpinus]|uniref:Flagellar motor switch protein FliM n=1 Tax=Arthrobacter alpinus TaxID=656366 RepID=A0A0M4QPI5_9MICC|nr:hypothetical protein AOC05_15915 [Arthrobacter alpinus]